MVIKVSQVKLPLDAALPGQERLEREVVAAALGLPANAIANLDLLRRSVDARRKTDVHFVATYAVTLAGECSPKPSQGITVSPYEAPKPLSIPDASHAFETSGEPRPVVVGLGPAGLFAALYLARAGLRPLVIERGAPVEERAAQVARFNAGGPLDPMNNIQFGEGGAGTFSDGKLTTNTKSPLIRHVLEQLVEAGAPGDILWRAHPHIGTDRLAGVVAQMRALIVEAGGDVRFHHLLENVMLEQGALAAVDIRNLKSGQVERVPARRLILACGHSARDTIAMLHDHRLVMERKPFSIGVRIEHPQALIDRAQYGAAAGHPALGAAEYKLNVRTPEGRGVYTFCMSPGGTVVAASSEPERLCVNGMSDYARSGANANAAVLVDVRPTDFAGTDVLAGIRFQRLWEHRAYELGLSGTQRPYTAPASTVSDFLNGGAGHPSALVEPTYPRGVAWEHLAACLPPFVGSSLREALPALDAKLHGFAHPEAVLTGIEARSSSPVRMVRDDSYQASVAFGLEETADTSCTEEPAVSRMDGSVFEFADGSGCDLMDKAAFGRADEAGCDNLSSGIYPCGEGAGYAGGIMSAAVDGLTVAQALTAHYLSEWS